MSIEVSSIDGLRDDVILGLNRPERGFFNSFGWFSNFFNSVAKVLNFDCFFLYQSQINNPLILPLMYEANHSLKVVKSMSNYYSPIFSLVGDRGMVESEISSFLQQINKRLPAWDLMELRPLSLEECDFLLSEFQKNGMPAIKFFCFGNWFLDVAGRSFTEYFSQLSSQVRNTVLRKSKKFFQLDGAKVTIFTSIQHIEEAIACYEQVYRSSWKVEEPFPEFMPGLIKLAASNGTLRLGVAYLGDKAIAAQVWIIADKTAYIFKLAYDDAYTQYSAGTILTSKLMEHAIDLDKVEIVDYLSGDDSYKKDWMSHRRERWGLLVFNTSSFRGCLEYLKETLKARIKRLRDIYVMLKTKLKI
ncbi:GNAT family N-acetyltransferase [Methylomonas sp. SURF-2]|uniref:GNAT family N-acetyltransferase n=1 Tax=Methylomonas subterranea TaxID=2952225 RepID=A0ABT1TCB2_9GAMM|nr:GNAT family N-acetyltransferase [Methylomonas sp. SURF-2]MCQ8103106.1 GNAT family N-acetyltransferase [Methylomonas sp. SURF-2]